MEEEIRFHLEMDAREMMDRGVDPAEARRRALARFGGVENHKEVARQVRGLGLLEEMLQDFRHAARGLRRSPAFATLAILTLALGIGANAAIFSVINGVLIRPLPYESPERLVRFLGYERGGDLDGNCCTISYANFHDWREAAATFEGMAAYKSWSPTLIREGQAERVTAAMVSPEFFQVLGVKPALGRFFGGEEEDGANYRVVISHAFWLNRFGGDSAAIGQTLTLEDRPYAVIGVTPRDFEDPEISGGEWVPVLWRPPTSNWEPGYNRGGRSFFAVGRLRPDVPLAMAQSEIDRIMARLEEAYPESNLNRAVLLRPLKEDLVGDIRLALLVLLGAAGLLLAVACVNVANLMLARSAAREREIAVRQALGASRGRLVRQLLTESVTLALIGGLAGLALANGSTRMLSTLASRTIPRVEHVALDVNVLLFALAISLLTGLLFGLAPLARRVDGGIRETLAEGGRSGMSRRQRRFRSLLVTAEMTLSVVLLVCAGLLLHSLWRLQSVDPGLRAGRVLTLRITPPWSRYGEEEAVSRLYRELEAKIGGLPGVQGMGTVDRIPLSGDFNSFSFELEDRPAPPPGAEPYAETRAATPGFFGTFGIHVLRGRGIAERDRGDAPPVVVINQAMAMKFWPAADPLGRRIEIWDRSWEIVGVVGDVREFGLDQDPPPTIYLPHEQTTQLWMRVYSTLLIRTADDPLSVAPAVRRAISGIDPTIPVSEVRPMSAVIGSTLAQPRFRTLLLGAFAGIALLLGVVGIYGVVSYGVQERLPELGVRMTLGAKAEEVVRHVMRQGLRPVLVGLVLGLVGSLAASRVLERLLFGVSMTDPVAFIAAPLLLTGAAILATWIPARRAARVDPVRVLRME